MIGGSVGYKGGGGLTRLFNKSGWKCVCKTTSQSDTARINPPSTPPDTNSRPQRRSNSVPAEPPPTSQTFRRKAKSNYRTPAAASPDIEDTTTSGKYLINGDFVWGSVNETTPTIIISNKRGADALPKSLKNGHFIKKVGDIDTVGTLNNIGDFYNLLESNDFYDKPVVLTVERGGAGGFGPREFKVKVILKRDIPRQGSVGGGKKTTYRRKKHVTRRKINTKRRKVMVGGDVLHKEVICDCTKEIKGNKQPEEGVIEGVGVEM